MCGQRLQRRPLDIQALAVASIAPANDLIDEAAIGLERSRNRATRGSSASSIARFR